MSRGLNWDRAKRRDMGRAGVPAFDKPPRYRKPTRKQLALVIQLRAEAGDPSPQRNPPRTLEAASVEISRLKEGKTPKPQKDLAADIERSVARRVQDSS